MGWWDLLLYHRIFQHSFGQDFDKIGLEWVVIGDVWMCARFFNGDGLMRDELIRVITWDLGNARRRGCRWDLEGFDGWEGGDGRGLISRVDEIGMVAIRQCKRSDGCGRWIFFGFPCKIPWRQVSWTRRSK